MICYVVTKVTAVASAVVGIDSETTTVPNKEIDSLCKPWPLKQALMAFDKGCISYTEKLQLLLFGLFFTTYKSGYTPRIVPCEIDDLI